MGLSPDRNRNEQFDTRPLPLPPDLQRIPRVHSFQATTQPTGLDEKSDISTLTRYFNIYPSERRAPLTSAYATRRR